MSSEKCYTFSERKDWDILRLKGFIDTSQVSNRSRGAEHLLLTKCISQADVSGFMAVVRHGDSYDIKNEDILN